jgi:hypothetical protein
LYGPGSHSLCAEFKTGVIRWVKRSKSLSGLAADARLYAHADDGHVHLLDPNPLHFHDY